MGVQIHIPKSLAPSKLDKLLAAGMFRSSDHLFKVDFLCIDNSISAPVPIRILLKDYKFKKSQRRTINKVERNCKVEIKKARISDLHEQLYDVAKKRFIGFRFPTLHDLMYDSIERPLFDTHQICVYEQGRLVAASFFDLGNTSLASLVGLHHPDFSELSLGYYTMLKEVEWALKNNLDYYYPGFVLDNNALFSYKLRLGNVQYLNEFDEWVDLKDVKDMQRPRPKELQDATQKLCKALGKNDISYEPLLNPFYTFSYFPGNDDSIISGVMPVFIKKRKQVIEYILDKKVYRLSRVSKNADFEFLKQFLDFTYYQKNKVYLQCIYNYADQSEEYSDLKSLLKALKK